MWNGLGRERGKWLGISRHGGFRAKYLDPVNAAVGKRWQST